MGTPTYRIGPSDFFSPGDLQADAATLDGQINALDSTIDGNEAIPQTEFDQWDAFLASWRGFRSSHFDSYLSSAASAINDSNRDQLISYENQFTSWVSTLGSFGVNMPAPLVQPSSGSGDTLGAQLNKQLAPLGLSATSALFIVAGFVVLWMVVKAS